MTITNSDLNELLDAVRAGGDIDVVRRGVELMLQALIDAEAILGARLEVVPGVGHDYAPQSWPRLVELITANAHPAASTY